MNPEDEKDESPIQGYLIGAGIPAGLLLWAGSTWVLTKVGHDETYLREASGTLLALQWLQAIGAAIAMLSALALVWSLRKKPPQ